MKRGKFSKRRYLKLIETKYKCLRYFLSYAPFSVLGIYS